jgi:hypothetical protein
MLTKGVVLFIKHCTDISIPRLQGFAVDEQMCTNGSFDIKKVSQHDFNTWF